ncbi:hypothetical protein M0802_016919 [Mischocyttarus mexicanus]|nr:hypothetical protein M0802_016919 [Mischocyttarus mexicanus]
MVEEEEEEEGNENEDELKEGGVWGGWVVWRSIEDVSQFFVSFSFCFRRDLIVLSRSRVQEFRLIHFL